MLTKVFLSLLAAVGTTFAYEAPQYDGLNLVWQDNFNGNGGAKPNGNNWNIIDKFMNVNNEWETYTAQSRNVQLSGGKTLQLVPWRDGGAQRGWTSGRIESKYTLTPQANKLTRVESKLRMGTATANQKQGIWPAFWMLGDSIRHNVAWPGCGEIDILEQVSGKLTTFGTVHCDVYPGGICNEGGGIGGNTGVADYSWHIYRVDIDRRKSSWRDETITWFLDGRQFFQINGARINNEAVWSSLARKPLFIIFNVAVGGDWVSEITHTPYNTRDHTTNIFIARCTQRRYPGRLRQHDGGWPRRSLGLQVSAGRSRTSYAKAKAFQLLPPLSAIVQIYADFVNTSCKYSPFIDVMLQLIVLILYSSDCLYYDL